MTDAICTALGCESPRGYGRAEHCEKHYYRMRRTGQLELASNRQATVKYRAAHWRIAQDRGPASSHACVDCGRAADHWSYTHTDPDEQHSSGGQPYSLNPECYDPRCAPCHARFDGVGANQYAR